MKAWIWLVSAFAVFIAALLIGPRVPYERQAEFCVVNVKIGGPLGISLNPPRGASSERAVSSAEDASADAAIDGEVHSSRSDRRPRRPPGPRLGELPLARRDIERLRLIVGLQRRLRDVTASPRAQRALVHRGVFREALTWLEIHGDAPELVEHWKALLAETGETGQTPETPPEATEEQRAPSSHRKRRRRRRRRGATTPN